MARKLSAARCMLVFFAMLGCLFFGFVKVRRLAQALFAAAPVSLAEDKHITAH
jgi:hypothetical protein